MYTPQPNQINHPISRQQHYIERSYKPRIELTQSNHIEQLNTFSFGQKNQPSMQALHKNHHFQTKNGKTPPKVFIQVQNLQNPHVRFQQNPSHQARNFHSVESISKNPMSNTLYNLMRQQIDIVSTNFRQKMNKVIKSQAQQIQKLMIVITKNTQVISKQFEVIKKLTENESINQSYADKSSYSKQSTRSGSKSPGKISLTQKKFIEKQTSPFKGMKNQSNSIQVKIDALVIKLNDIEKKLKQQRQNNMKVPSKVQEVQRTVNSQIWKNLKKNKYDIEQFIKKGQERCNKIQSKLYNDSLKQKQAAQRVKYLQQEIEQLKILLANALNREYTYDSYQLKVLKQQMDHLKRIISTLPINPKTEFTSQSNIEKPERKNQDYQLNYSQKLIPNKKIKNTTPLGQSQLSTYSQYSPRRHRKQQQEQDQQQSWLEQSDISDRSGEQDEFFYPEYQSPSQDDEERQLRLYQLQRIARMKRLPLKVQIDNTGYLKQCENGMYLLDDHGDGFVLNEGQLRILMTKGIITF